MQLLILKGLTYEGQKEGLERDLSDLLTDNHFLQVNTFGSGLKRPRSELLSSVPKRGLVLAQLGDSVPTPIDWEPDSQRAVFKALAIGSWRAQRTSPRARSLR